jgi:hypothetical protein
MAARVHAVDTDENLVALHGDDDVWITADTDSFQGGSGAGWFDEEGRIFGVFMRGARDLHGKQGFGCLTTVTVPQGGPVEEQALSIAAARNELCASALATQHAEAAALCGEPVSRGCRVSGGATMGGNAWWLIALVWLRARCARFRRAHGDALKRTSG